MSHADNSFIALVLIYFISPICTKDRKELSFLSRKRRYETDVINDPLGQTRFQM